jgi:hypothetical protein
MDALLSQIGQDAPVALTTLSRILGNVVNSPDNAKYRTLKKTSKAMANDIVGSQAAMSLLLAVGFNDCGETLELPMDADLQVVSEVVDLIAALQLSREYDDPVHAKPMPTIVAGTIVRNAGYSAEQIRELQRRTNNGASQDGSRVALDAAQQRARVGEGERPSATEADELQKARELWKNQSGEVAAADTSSVSTTASSVALEIKPPALPVPSGTRKKSEFDFRDRRERERKEREAAQAMEDMRQAQKQKYSNALDDPLAFKGEAYSQPPCVTLPASSSASERVRWCCLFGGGRA